jgi:Zn-finger nucleic acid-binding protein
MLLVTSVPVAILILLLALSPICLFAFFYNRFIRKERRNKVRHKLSKGRRQRRREVESGDERMQELLNTASGELSRDSSCPRCQRSMERKSLGGLPLLFCPKCQGILTPLLVLEKALTSMLKMDEGERSSDLVDYLQEEGEKRQSTRDCPVCRERMGKKAYSALDGLTLDICESCDAVWFDGGELATLSKFDPETCALDVPDKGGDIRAIKHLKARAAGERSLDSIHHHGDVDYLLRPFLARYQAAKLNARIRRKKRRKD